MSQFSLSLLGPPWWCLRIPDFKHVRYTNKTKLVPPLQKDSQTIKQQNMFPTTLELGVLGQNISMSLDSTTGEVVRFRIFCRKANFSVQERACFCREISILQVALGLRSDRPTTGCETGNPWKCSGKCFRGC